MKSINILLIEDNEGDILLTSEAFEESRIVNKLTVIKDGQAAINFFQSLDQHSKLPDLILLDINLPKKSGHEVLIYLKNDRSFQHIPVIMLTTSSSQNDIRLSYKHHVNCYITKPLDVSDFLMIINRITEFWTGVVSIPLK